MIDLSKISFWKSVLLVVISTTIIFAIVDFLIYQPINILTAPVQSDSQLQGFPSDMSGFTAGFSQMFLSILILTSLIQAGFAVFSWWASVIVTDYVAIRFFKLQSNYEHLIPAFAIIYAVIAVIASISFLVSFEMTASNILWRAALLIIGWLLFVFAIKDIYEIGWKKAFLVDLAGTIVMAGAIILGFLVGAGIGLVAGLII